MYARQSQVGILLVLALSSMAVGGDDRTAWPPPLATGTLPATAPPVEHAGPAEAASPYGASPFVSYQESHPLITPSGEAEFRGARKHWGISVAALIAANLLDAHSSWGKREQNRALRDASGRFGPRSAAVKAGMVSSALAAQHLAARKDPGLLRPFTWLNYSIAAAFTGTAARNYRVQ